MDTPSSKGLVRAGSARIRPTCWIIWKQSAFDLHAGNAPMGRELPDLVALEVGASAVTSLPDRWEQMGIGGLLRSGPKSPNRGDQIGGFRGQAECTTPSEVRDAGRPYFPVGVILATKRSVARTSWRR